MNIHKKALYFIIVIFFSVMSMVACDSRIKFEKEQDDFGSTYTNPNINIQIANNVENHDELFQRIEQDLNIINDFAPIKSLEIRVERNPSRARKEDQILIRPELVSTDDLRKAIIAGSYDLYDQWKVEGICGNLFEAEGSGDPDQDPNTKKSNSKNNGISEDQRSDENAAVDFRSYFQQNELSLFSLRFDEEYSSHEEVENLKLVSIDLVKYLLKQGKKEQLLKEEITIDDIKAWASENEIDTEYLETIYPHIENISVGESWMFFRPEIKTKREINGFNIHLIDRNERYDTAKELENIIKTFDEDIAANLKVIREQAPNFYKEFEKPLTEVPTRITYRLEKRGDISFVPLGSYSVHLTRIESQMVEYNHILLQESFRSHGIFVNKPMWLLDGFDVCLAKLYSDSFPYKKLMASYIEQSKSEPTRNLSPREQQYIDAIDTLIQENFATVEEQIDNLENRRTFLHIIFGEGLQFGDMSEISGFGKDTKVAAFTGNPAKKYDGIEEPDNLNVYANYSFVAYLMEEYGLEKMLYFGVQDFEKITFEEYFGKSYEQLDADWKQYLIDNIKSGELLVYGEEGSRNK
ncbi:MAG: hypothetical protein Q4A75_02460 [Peptostreptococcaceae bacterium]|nr:hypothetical protein [Peptostreptococcaceae bacterium]